MQPYRLRSACFINTTSRAAIRKPTCPCSARPATNFRRASRFSWAGAIRAVSTVNQNLLILQYGTPIAPDNQGLASHNFSYKAALNWTINDEQLPVRLRRDRLQAGWPQHSVRPRAAAVSPFGPETVINYETGWKSSFFDHHLLTQIDGFYNNFKNFQVIIGYPAFPTFGFEVNDPNATKLYGFEGSAQAVFGDLSFDTNIGFTHSSLGTFYAVDPRVGSYDFRAVRRRAPSSPSCVNLGGHPQTYAPNFTFNVGAQYDFKLDGGDTLTPRVNFGHVSGQWATLFENSALGDRLAPARHPGRAAGLDARRVCRDALRHQPDRRSLRRRAQFEPRLRRAAAPVRHPHHEERSDARRPVGRRSLQTQPAADFSFGLFAHTHMQSYALTVDKFLDHAAKWSGNREVVTARARAASATPR